MNLALLRGPSPALGAVLEAVPPLEEEVDLDEERPTELLNLRAVVLEALLELSLQVRPTRLAAVLHPEVEGGEAVAAQDPGEVAHDLLGRLGRPACVDHERVTNWVTNPNA